MDAQITNHLVFNNEWPRRWHGAAFRAVFSSAAFFASPQVCLGVELYGRTPPMMPEVASVINIQRCHFVIGPVSDPSPHRPSPSRKRTSTKLVWFQSNCINKIKEKKNLKSPFFAVRLFFASSSPSLILCPFQRTIEIMYSFIPLFVLERFFSVGIFSTFALAQFEQSERE